jgi:pimeloyl-ACP methyl ester carboxylesterase
MMVFFKRMVVMGLLLVAGLVLLITGCQSKLIYFPRDYPAGATTKWQAMSGGRIIDYRTGQGAQQAYLLGNLKQPARLWVVCGGNATLALEWSAWLRANAPGDDAWLLVDYPGYGECEGSPTPGRIRESFRELLPIAAREVGLSLPADADRLRFFAHSLGGSAALIAACDHGIRQGVLMAPFTSTMDMARRVIGLPVGFLVWHRYDNEARLDELVAAGPIKIVIVHGARDEIIPVAMGRSLAARHPQVITLREIPDGHHNDLQEVGREALVEAIREVRE